MDKLFTSVLFFIYITLSSASLSHRVSLDDLTKTYDLITEKIKYDKENNQIKSTAEIQTNEQILIIPLTKVISSAEPYQFEEFFNRNQREKLIGRLLIEKFIGQNSTQHQYIESLPSPGELTDYYHYSEENIKELNRRVYFTKGTFENRKEQYESLIKKIPSNPMSQVLLNWDLYNWASSIINCNAMIFKKYYYYGEVKRVNKFIPSTTQNNNLNEELCLIPGLNIFKKGKFNNLLGNKLDSNVFVYKNNIYLNSDRFIDEDQEVFNEIQFQSNKELFEQCGNFVEDFYHEEIKIKLSSTNWDINRYNLCKELGCMGDSSSPEFLFRFMLNQQFLLYCQIDQLNGEENLKAVYKQLRQGKRISKENHLKSLARGVEILKDFAKKNNKTKLAKDILDLEKVPSYDRKRTIMIKYAISQKMILLHQMKLLNDKIIVEMNEDLFGSIKKRYI